MSNDTEMIGFDEGSEFARWVDDITDKGLYEDVLDDVGKQAVDLSTEKISKNKVTPKTSQATLDARRRPRGKKKQSGSGITLLDTGVGIKQIAYESGFDEMAVGVPAGYMAAHQEGTVPNAPRRKFLTMPKSDDIVDTVEFYWKKVTKD